jgi:hypothetical protein
LRTGISIITTDKINDATFANVCGGAPFCYTMLTFQYDGSGGRPNIAVDSSPLSSYSRVVEVHQDGDSLYYRCAQIQSTQRTAIWEKSSVRYDSGHDADIAL